MKRWKRFTRNLTLSLVTAVVAAAVFNSYADAQGEFTASPEAQRHAEIVEYIRGLIVKTPELKPVLIEVSTVN